jgi:exportin-2 (importin alpha re-exporter)
VGISASRSPEPLDSDVRIIGIMRVVITVKQGLIPIYPDVLKSLTAILNEICKNPSNPSFDQFCFESISALLRQASVF